MSRAPTLLHERSNLKILITTSILLITAGALRAQEQPSPPAKRVEIDKTHQVLRAYEGNTLILQSRISTGKGNSTPNGSYHVEGLQRMHYSKRYHDAPMPYSVQVSGHYFIHGFSYVPNRPASQRSRVPRQGTRVHQKRRAAFSTWSKRRWAFGNIREAATALDD